ncbi:MAG TPA: glycosyltransferase family 39 protein [Planctomycetaceae bacterium]|jgi:4-amino-4-deoxy-L-arabinose transferase-like glycosyltransferase
MPTNRVTERLSWLALAAIVAVLVLASGLRAGVLWKFGAQLAEDPDHYRRIAKQLTAGQGYSDPQTGAPTAYRPPVYPLLLAAIIRCRGSDSAIGIVQAVLGVGTVALTICAGRRMGLGRGSIVAGILVAVDPILLHQTSQVMTETTATFLAALCLWLGAMPMTPLRGFLLGIVFGAACLCRPTFWGFGILAGLIWLVNRMRSSDWQEGFDDREIQPVFFALVGLLAVVAPWVHRNATVMQRPTVTTTHGGYTLLLAHNPEYTRAVVEQPWGTVWQSPSFDQWTEAIDTELAARNPPLDQAHLSPPVELARDAWMYDKAWIYMQCDPKTAVKAGLTLLGRMWNIMPAATNEAGRSREVRMAIGAFYIAVLAGLVIGILRVVFSDWQAWWPPVALILSYTAVHALYWADMRMRAPLVPAIALLAAAGCLGLVREPADEED